ncbi:M14 metallopeptidase family protein [Allomuricauda sp. F6463D]|uniref:M14 family metallopeptidase n=1 Tax=Allomuricauda sp. F6463D TaxID=2926409 RepID=UPI001FF3D2A8|nr:M14 metallopeptidase family protein [Muricauda sp. F6463D]MCK0159505.1 M14 family metallopeptidase [Muricauda sp. F6463D]
MIDYLLYKEKSINGRYINADIIQPCFSKLPFPLIHIGNSVDGIEINAFKLGSGQKKILMWSQMHGNESTTTKAVWDMVNFLQSENPLATQILKECNLLIVPMLNPDGANLYTRENINKVDLNRDAKNLSQPESIALRNLFKSFQPNFCFNLHDQRTLFSAGNTDKSATISFLSPSSNKARDITPAREVAMKLIVGMNKMLQKHIPGQVGRYDDGFNDNCIGDTFQMLGVPTILFESGHYPKDYEREKTREYIFLSMLEALKIIAEDKIDMYSTGDYFSIPGNQKLFFDVIIENPELVNPEIEQGQKIGIRYKEVLDVDKVIFTPEIVEIGALDRFYAHKTIVCVDTKDFGFNSAEIKLLDLLLKTKN